MNGSGSSAISIRVSSATPPGAYTVTVTASGSSPQTGTIVHTGNVSVVVAAPPQITASISPAPAAGGWNSWGTTVSFTCTAGTFPIQSCPGPQTVTAEGTGQVVTGVVTDTGGNTAQASITLNIDKTPPTVTIDSPAEASLTSSATVTVTGTVSDSLSGLSGSVMCNDTPATVSGSSFSCNASLQVGTNLIVVKAADAAGNVAWVRLHLTLSGTLSTASALAINPSGATMLAGEVREFTATDESGRPRKDATWTVADTSVLSLTTDESGKPGDRRDVSH